MEAVAANLEEQVCDYSDDPNIQRLGSLHSLLHGLVKFLAALAGLGPAKKIFMPFSFCTLCLIVKI